MLGDYQTLIGNHIVQVSQYHWRATLMTESAQNRISAPFNFGCHNSRNYCINFQQLLLTDKDQVFIIGVYMG